jgi:hypothetical protein
MAFGVVNVTEGTGTGIAVDTVAGKNYQQLKFVDGTEGSTTPIPGDGNGLVVQGSVAADIPVAGKPMLTAGRASDATPAPVSGDGDAVHAWNNRRGARKVAVVDDDGDSVMDGTTNSVRVNVVSGSSVGTEYAENSTVTTAQGQVPLWEDTGNVYRTISAAQPLPVNVITGATSGTQYTEADTDATITGTVAMWEDTSDTLRAPSVAKPFPVQVITSPGGSVLPDPIVNSSAVAVPLKFASVNATADGDNTAIAAVGGKKLRVVGGRITCTGAGTISFKTGGGGVIDRFISSANGSGFADRGGVDCPLFETVSGEALLLNNPAGIDSVGNLTYIEV